MIKIFTCLGVSLLFASTAMASTPDRVKFNASVSNETEILYEDFSNVPDGKQEQIGSLGYRYTDCIASEDYSPGPYIDSSYTPNSGTWEGDYVYAGKGGTVILQCYNPSGYPAVLRTPLGDYSGDITIKVRCRFSTPFYGANNDLGYVTSGGTQLSCRVGIGGYETNEDAVTDIEGYSLDSKIFYESEGWNEVTFTLRNESANGDGFIEFSTLFALEIDWIKITDAGTYLAAPVVNPVTEFYNDGFTISWSPVRQSYDYYIDLWKMEYTGEAAQYAVDFDDNALPADWNSNDGEIVANGKEGSNAFKCNTNGYDGAIVSPEFSEKIASFSYSAKFDVNDEAALNGYGIYGMLYADGLTDDGWEAIANGDMYCDGALTEGGVFYDFNLSGSDFSGKYKAVRIYQYGVKSTNYAVIDNIQITLQKPYKLTRLIDPEKGAIRDTENDDADYNRYYFTGDPKAPCSYTFTGLDPEGEYFYRVRSHNVSKFAGTEKHHAFGVASPKLLPATDKTETSFTANWEDVAKAQSYVVTNYKVSVVEEDEDDYMIFNETFSKCNGGSQLADSTPIGNTEAGNLDDYTDMRGWTGKNNYIGDSFIGGDWSTDTQLITPPLSIDPAKGTYYVYLEAWGYKGDMLYIEFEKAGTYTTINFSGSELAGGFEVEAVSDGERLKFNSYYYMPYALRKLEIYQEKSKGDVVRLYDSETVVPAGVGSLAFSDLESEGLYEYTVKARYDLEYNTVYSLGTDAMRVDLSNGNGLSKVNDDTYSYEIGRYDLNGLPVANDYKGFVIVKMSDGSARKMMTK